ncbi:MAG: hypothetical protein QXZ41_03080 [Ignisphaera sp.]
MPFAWILMVANISNIVLVLIAGVNHIHRRKYLPKEIRTPIWSAIILAIEVYFGQLLQY